VLKQWRKLEPNKQTNTRLTAIFQDNPTRITRYLNVTILHFIGAKDDEGGDENWSYKTRKAVA